MDVECSAASVRVSLLRERRQVPMAELRSTTALQRVDVLGHARRQSFQVVPAFEQREHAAVAVRSAHFHDAPRDLAVGLLR